MSPTSINPDGERDRCEVKTVDDMASEREVEFRELAFLNQKLAAAREPRAVPGVCTNCGESCMPSTVYCDTFCREDHEHRQARQGQLSGVRGRDGNGE